MSLWYIQSFLGKTSLELMFCLRFELSLRIFKGYEMVQLHIMIVCVCVLNPLYNSSMICRKRGHRRDPWIIYLLHAQDGSLLLNVSYGSDTAAATARIHKYRVVACYLRQITLTTSRNLKTNECRKIPFVLAAAFTEATMVSKCWSSISSW